MKYIILDYCKKKFMNYSQSSQIGGNYLSIIPQLIAKLLQYLKNIAIFAHILAILRKNYPILMTKIFIIEYFTA